MKKPITLLITLLCLLALSSCKDDNDGISADIHSPITGYWQIAGTSIETGADINGDGAVEGIVVHDDGTVSEWQYTQATEDPFKLGYKTGTWTIDGNHYVMLLSKGNNKHYTVTVAGNDNKKMYLAYNGKTSVVPFYRIQHLPGDGDSMMEMMAQMKFSGIQLSDLAGYWELTSNDNPNGVGNGIYNLSIRYKSKPEWTKESLTIAQTDNQSTRNQPYYRRSSRNSSHSYSPKTAAWTHSQYNA